MSASYPPPPEVEQLRHDWENASSETVEFDDRWLRLAKGAVKAILHYGYAQKWEELETWGKTLQGVAARFADNAEIQLELAKGAVNAISRYGDAQKWEELEAWGKTLKDVAFAACFANEPKIQRQLAMGAFNAIFGYGDAQKWEELEAWGKTLQDVANDQRFAHNAEFQLRLAKGAFNAITDYGAAQKWEELEAWGNTLKNVAARFAKNPGIQLRLAQGAVNAIYNYGTAQKWEELEAWGKELKGVANDQRFADNAYIQLELAGGAVNAISGYGAVQKWEELEAWGKTLKDVAARFADNEEIQLRLTQGAVNAISGYGDAQKWEKLEAWGKELKGVVNDQRFADKAEIQLALAIGAVNAMITYRKTGKSKNMEKWKETEEGKRWNQWGKELLKIIKTKEQIPAQFSRADEKEFFRFADKWEWDDDFCGLLNNDEIANKKLRALWEAQEDVVELLRVEFSDTSKEENGAVYQVAHYISVEDLERMIQLKEKEEKKKDENGKDVVNKIPPEKLQLKSVSSANDPTEGKIFQQFLNPETAVIEKQNEKICSSEMLIAVQASFTRCIDSLNQFRLYGNLPDAPGTGLCLVFDKKFFADGAGKNSFINSNKPENKESANEKNIDDEAQDHLPLYWVLYYDYRNKVKPFFIHTPTQCALRVDDNTDTKEYQKKYSWASERNTAIFNALQAVKTKYLAIIRSANNEIKRANSGSDEIERSEIKTAAEERKKAAWNLLIYLRHLVKDAAFAEEQEMRILKLCRFGDEKIRRLNPTKDLLGFPYLHILHKYHCVKKVIAGPKMEKFISRSTRWRHEIAQYAQSENLPLSFDIEFSQSKAPLV